MKKNYKFATWLLLLVISKSWAGGPYSPVAGEPGSKAIHKDSTAIVSWATGIEVQRGYINAADTSVYHSGSNRATFGHPSNALGTATGASVSVVSLGDGGIATLSFDRPIFNGPGPDFAVFENSFSDVYLELAFVEVSSDGANFVRFPAVSLTQYDTQVGGFGSLDPTNIHNFAGKYRQGYGTPFDLEELKDSSNIDINNVRFVRIIDVVGCIDCEFATFDSQGNVVNDPWPSPFESGGFDLEAVAVINGGAPYIMASYDNLPLDEDTAFQPTEAGSFQTNNFRFHYDASEWAWSGFTYSRKSTITGDNIADQFTAITRGGMQGEGSTYLVSYVQNDWESPTYDPIPVKIEFTDERAHRVSGFYVTNNVWAYDVMLNGDMFAKKFGGETGDDPDWFKIIIWGEKENGEFTDSVHFYLADYRFENNYYNYIVDNWRWVDLVSLGEVKALYFVLASSDTGDFGMNTPGFFCMDNLTLLTQLPVSVNRPIADQSVRQEGAFSSKVYPNPFGDVLTIEAPEGSRISIINTMGQVLEEHTGTGSPLTLYNLPVGYHIVRVVKGTNVESFKVIKR
jgi:hypothetical protein